MASPLQDRDARHLSAPVEALIFKSGQSYVYRDVPIEPGARTTELRLPEALRGTAWLASTDVEIEGATAREAVTIETEDVVDLAGVIQRAIGHDAILNIRLGSDVQPVSGKILRTIDGTTPRWGATQRGNRVPALVAVVFSHGVVGTCQIRDVVGVVDLDPNRAIDDWTFARERRVPVLDVRHASLQQGAAGRLGVGALTSNWAWTPSYVLELRDDTPARLVGKAVLVNDSEPLFDTRVRLAIGYPNLEYGNVLSSLLPEVTLDAFRDALQRGPRDPTGRARVMSQTNVDLGRAAPSRPATVPGPVAQVPGRASEDFYVYPIGSVTLEEGERAHVPSLEAAVPISHRFDWDVEDLVKNGRFEVLEDREREPFWHVLLLDNNGKAPWTTAPVLIKGATGPLAQSTLHYTPAGAKHARVKLTKSLDLVDEASETRAEGTVAPRETVRVFGHLYEAIEIQGRLAVTNRSGESRPVRVRKSFSGDLMSADGEPDVSALAHRLWHVNVLRVATWDFELEAGERREVEFRYRVVIRC